MSSSSSASKATAGAAFARTSQPRAADMEEVAIVGFQGGNEWIRAQLERQRAKTQRAAAVHARAEPLVRFDRAAFTAQVVRILDLDENAGFVIGLKRRREFATKLCQDYKLFTEAQKLELVLALAVDLGLQDLSKMVKALPSLPRTRLVLNVMAAALGFSRTNDPDIAKSVKKGLVPVPEQLFLLIGSVSPGPKFLLKLRVDLTHIRRKYGPGLPSESVRALEYLDMVMRDLFATQAGTRFRRIDMASEKLVSFVMKYERVHAVRDWMDLKRRISGPNRFCFGLFHLHMPYAPLVFVQVIVSDHLCDRIDPILDRDGPAIENQTHIIFYSISNANPGLRELNTASHLLFLTIERMSSMYPQCHTSATLSPVPGFAAWFKTGLDRPFYQRLFFSDEQTQRLTVKYGVNHVQLGKWLLKRLNAPDWHHDEEFASAVRDVLVAACARYVLFERNGDKMLNAVANFHLQNGAQVEQINFMADPSPAGIGNALGFMINYRYCMTSIAHTSVSYKRTSAAAASLRVLRLSYVLTELEKLQEGRNIPLFARAYQPGDVVCKRGSLPTAVYFICSGKVRVQSAHPYSLTDGAIYGHHEILNHEPVPFTVKAETKTHLILLPEEDLNELVKESSVLREYAMMSERQRLQYDQGRQASAAATTVSRL